MPGHESGAVLARGQQALSVSTPVLRADRTLRHLNPIGLNDICTPTLHTSAHELSPPTPFLLSQPHG